MTSEIKAYLETIRKVKGLWIELGVFRGDTFKQLVPFSRDFQKSVVGVDSFEGMAEPVEQDKTPDGLQPYPKGKLNAGGCERLMNELTKMGYEQGREYMLFEGFVPAVFDGLQDEWVYSLCLHRFRSL